jgi:hypothetical protein
MMDALLLRHKEQLRAGRPHHLWPMQGWALSHALLTLEELPLGTSGRQPPQRSLTPTPSVQSLVGQRTWSGTSLKLTWRQEVQKHLARRYLHLRPRAQGCHDAQLIGITSLGRRIGLKITRTCRSYGLASSPSIMH